MADLFPGEYWAPVVELLADPLGHLSTVTAYPAGAAPFTLAVEPGSLQVTFAEDWAPYAQVQLDCPVLDAEQLDALDPRRNCRLQVAAGYSYPDRRTDVQALADVALRERGVRRPANLVQLRAASDEARAQDYRIRYNANFDRRGINEAVRWLLGFAVNPDVPQLVSDFPEGAKASLLADIEADIGTDVWSILDDVAARAGVRIWCDEKRIWRIAARAERTGATSLDLTVGQDGTLITSDSGLNREDWYNAVVLRYRWRDGAGNEQTRIGRASVIEGIWGTNEVGGKVYFEDVDRPASQAGADAAAVSRLRTLVTRGRSLKLTAGAAYWIRPGQTVRVKLVTGGWSNHLVQSVTFRPHTGLMDLVTREPANVKINSGE